LFGTGRVISGDQSRDKRDMSRRGAQAASAMASLGISEGDALASYMRNDYPLFEAQVAAKFLGVYVVPINWHFTAAETEYILKDSDAKVLIVHADLLAGIESSIPDGVKVIIAPTPDFIAEAYGVDKADCSVPENMTPWDEFIDDFQEWSDPPRPPREIMNYTSGTTGNPKGVVKDPLTPEEEQKAGVLGNLVYGVRPGMRILMTGPCYHIAVNHSATIGLMSDAELVLQPRFDAEQFLQLVEQHKITHTHMVPTMFVRLLKLTDKVKDKYDISSLEWITHGAAPCSPDVKRAMIDWFGPILGEYYGGTEIGISNFCTSQKWLDHPGTVGRITAGSTIRIYGDDRKPLPPGEIGEIYGVTDLVTDFAYKGLTDKRKEVEIDGLVSIGDMGYMDEDGYLFLCDRKNDMVISGGVNIYPAEIEAVLVTMEGVRDCAVFGIPNEEFGESLMAMVELESSAGLSEDDVRQFLVGRLAKYKVPHQINFRDNLPREDSGKIFKRKLREPYWQDAGRVI
jgi:long-chain acyl-CoA synthetase